MGANPSHTQISTSYADRRITYSNPQSFSLLLKRSSPAKLIKRFWVAMILHGLYSKLASVEYGNFHL